MRSIQGSPPPGQVPDDGAFGRLTNNTVFNVPLASAIGLNEAIVLGRLKYWIEVAGRDPERHLRDGRLWTYQSVRDLQEQFPFWSTQTVQNAITSLIKQDLVLVGNYNRRKGDRTRWFALNHERLNELAETLVGGCLKSRQPVKILDEGVQNLDGAVKNLDDVTNRYPGDTQEERKNPDVRSGESEIFSPPSIENGGAQKDAPERDAEVTPPNPLPPPPALAADAEDRIHRAAAKVTPISSARGWTDEMAEKARSWLLEHYGAKNKSRCTSRDLKLVRYRLAPDETKAFRKQTLAYLASIDDPKFVMALGRWLEEWREWAPTDDVPKTSAERTQAWIDRIKMAN